jgi:Concanavalin A-like lectin/glucanases superfamily
MLLPPNSPVLDATRNKINKKFSLFNAAFAMKLPPMKLRFNHLLARVCTPAAALLLTSAGTVQAGLTLQFNVIHDCYGSNYTLAPNLYLNGNGGDSTPITFDQVTSPDGSFLGGVGNGSTNTRAPFPDLNSMIHAATNGTWHLMINVGDPSQHTYTFTVSSTLNVDPYANAVVDYPPDGANQVVPLPNFAWHGPANAGTLEVYVYGGPQNVFQQAQPSVPTTSLTLPPALTNGNFIFVINYESDVSTLLVATTPLDASSHPPANLNSLALFDTGSQAGFDVQFYPAIANVSGGHTNIAHYTFDQSGPQLDTDSSGNGNDLNDVWWGPVHSFSTDAKTGGGAVQFVGTSDMYTPTYNPSFAAWSNTFAASFTASAWIKTTNTVNNDGDDLTYASGQDVINANSSGPGTIPIGLTGGKAAFSTMDTNGNADTLHSQQTVTTGAYVHIVSTRDQTTGLKCIYVNGQLDSSNYATTALLTGETSGNIGGHWGYAGYTGLVDDVQIYSGALLAGEVSNLFANPGTTIADVISSNTFSPPALAAALNATNLTWSVVGDAAWFSETTNSNDGISALQSGPLLDNQSAIVRTTVTGPGTLTFWWSCAADDDSFDLEFDVDGHEWDDINSFTSWTQDPQVGATLVAFPIPAGIHVLSWNANTFFDTGSSPEDTGWLDDVVFTPAFQGPSPVTLLNPQLVGTNLQFSFVAQNGHTNLVQYNTNLLGTNWQTYSTIVGDGTSKTVSVPVNSPKQEFFRVQTQ